MHTVLDSWNWDLWDAIRLHAFVCLFAWKNCGRCRPRQPVIWPFAKIRHSSSSQKVYFYIYVYVLLQRCLCTSTYMFTPQRQISFETNIWLRLFPLLWGNFHMAMLSLTSCQSLSLRSKTAQHCFPWDLWPLSFLLSSRIEQLFLALLERRASCTKERDSFIFIIGSNPHQS